MRLSSNHVANQHLHNFFHLGNLSRTWPRRRHWYFPMDQVWPQRCSQSVLLRMHHQDHHCIQSKQVVHQPSRDWSNESSWLLKSFLDDSRKGKRLTWRLLLLQRNISMSCILELTISMKWIAFGDDHTLGNLLERLPRRSLLRLDFKACTSMLDESKEVLTTKLNEKVRPTITSCSVVFPIKPTVNNSPCQLLLLFEVDSLSSPCILLISLLHSMATDSLFWEPLTCYVYNLSLVIVIKSRSCS